MAHIQKRVYNSKRTGQRTVVWQARYSGPDGKERSKRFERRVDAERWLSTNSADIARGLWIDPDAGHIAFGDYACSWQKIQVHRPSTAEWIDIYLRRHVLPTLELLPLGSIRPSEVQALIKRQSATLAPATVETGFRILSAIFKAAVLDRRIAFNPCSGAKLPERASARVEPPTTNDVLSIIDTMPERYRALAVTAAGCGLRQAEACGLTLDRIDFLRRVVTIDRQLLTLNGRPTHLGPPKTKASVRDVPLPNYVADHVAAHLAAFPVSNQLGLVFTSDSGTPVHRQMLSRIWAASVKRSDVTAKVTFHGLRHYYASLLIRHGESVTTVQARLGHASASETLNTYAHLWPDAEDRTRQAVDDVMLGAAAERQDDGAMSTGRTPGKQG